MRNAFAETFHQLARRDSRLCLLCADISPAGALEQFRAEFPKRFLNVGIAEQAMIGVSSGMALRGLRPFAYTIAAFALFRPYEFVRLDLAYQNVPVTVVGMGGGVSYSSLGSTHHAIEDVVLACSLPNMRVIAPCDAEETRAATEYCAVNDRGPIYLRLGKAGEPNLTANALQPFEFGNLRKLRDGKDAVIIGYGPILKLALDAAYAVADTGQSVAVYDCHTLKPLDMEGIAAVIKGKPKVIVLEEAVECLGLRVKALRPDAVSICLQDRFTHVYGSRDEVLADHGITIARLIREIS